MYYMKITAYAEELLTALDNLPGWPEQVKRLMQKPTGSARAPACASPSRYTLDGKADEKLWVFTTRADTIMGVTFVAVAAEHPLATRLQSQQSQAGRLHRRMQARFGHAEADLATMEKKGMPTGISSSIR
jgi:leucyl-tRNA synthetase